MQRRNLVVEDIPTFIETAETGLQYLFESLSGNPIIPVIVRLSEVGGHFQNVQRSPGIAT